MKSKIASKLFLRTPSVKSISIDSNLGLLVLYTFNLFQLRLMQRFVLVIQNNIILVIYRNKLTD
jgi:hypothetical protein